MQNEISRKKGLFVVNLMNRFWTDSFKLYINDIVNVSNKFKYVLLANDTNILYSKEEYKNAEKIVNRELHQIYDFKRFQM